MEFDDGTVEKILKNLDYFIILKNVIFNKNKGMLKKLLEGYTKELTVVTFVDMGWGNESSERAWTFHLTFHCTVLLWTSAIFII